MKKKKVCKFCNGKGHRIETEYKEFGGLSKKFIHCVCTVKKESDCTLKK